MFIISQLWLTSHPRSTVVLQDTETPGTSREIDSEDADEGARTRSPSVLNREAIAIELFSTRDWEFESHH